MRHRPPGRRYRRVDVMTGTPRLGEHFALVALCAALVVGAGTAMVSAAPAVDAAAVPGEPAGDQGEPRVPPRVPPPPPVAQPVVAPRREVTVIRLRPRPRPGPFSMNLYRRGDFRHQLTKDWCVAGSTQTMMNIMNHGKVRRFAPSQQRLYVKGRRLSPMKRKLGPIGIDLVGWADLLNRGGYGPYVVEGGITRRGAIHKAARALRLTGRPVGLVVWRGAHSWVMSGFRATGDPAHTRDYEVTAVYIQDTWYPWVSTIWGSSRPPNALVPVAALAEDFLPYRRPLGRYPRRDGKFMLILPELPAHTVAR